MRKTLIAAGALLAASFCRPAIAVDWTPLAEQPEALSFGIISTEATAQLKQQWEPFLTDMQTSIGMKINAFYATDYAGVIEGMRFGKVHLAWFGNKSGMEAVDRAHGEVFAQTVAKDGSLGYYSHVIVPADSPIRDLKDLLKCDRSLNFGLGDPNSTSGFLVPSYYVFAVHKADPKTCFKTVRNANHETNLLAVANKQVDAATNNSEQLDRTRARRPEIVEKVRVIWTSPLIPLDPIVWRADLSPELKAKVKAFFLDYGRKGDTAHARKVLAGIGSGLAPFKESSNAQLVPIRQLELFKQRTRLEADASLSDAERQAKLAEIDRRLAALSGQATTH